MKTRKKKMMDTLRTKGSGRDRAIDIIIGANIKRMRAQRDMSQEALGKKLGGITFQQVQKYEKGMNSVACCRVPQMCRALSCSLAQLFDGAMEEKDKANPFPTMSALAIRLAQDLDKLPKVRRAVQHLVDAHQEGE